MKYKICYVTTIPLTLRAFVVDTAKTLYETGKFDITFVCDEDDTFRKELPSYFHYHAIPMKRGISLSGISAFFAMKKFFTKEQFDLVQYSTPNASFYASLASKSSRIPHRIYCQWGIAYVGFQGLKRKIFKRVEKLVCKNSTLIEPDSHGNLDFSVSEGLYPREKGRVIGYGSASGVNLKKFDINQKEKWRQEIRTDLSLEDCLVYGFVGRLDKDKGLNELLAAYNAIKNEHTRLMIVGPDDKKDTLNELLYQTSLDDPTIIYTGPTKTVEKYLSAMDVFILPSYREGFGSVVIEAEAMELPIITTDIPGPRESILPGITGIQIPMKDTEALVEAMEQMKDPQLRSTMAKAGRTFVEERFDSEYVHAKILEDRLHILESRVK